MTTEANPESTSPELFDALRAAGYTRVSLGMQSVAPHVLRCWTACTRPAVRAPPPGRRWPPGFEHVSLDLIYGTPGETDDDLLRSVDAAVGAGVDHVSAYALVVEDGTALARRVRRGEIDLPDDDVLARRYELLDARLRRRRVRLVRGVELGPPGGECRHNLGYWNGGQWWGAGPGAHGFVGSTRWWNVKHPNAYARALAEGALAGRGFRGTRTRPTRTPRT